MLLADFLNKETFLFFSILILIAMAALISERAGIINIALEGKLIAATLGYTLFSFFLKNLPDIDRYFFGLFGALLFSLIVTLIFAFLVIHLKLDQILVAIAINIIAFGATVFIIIHFRHNVELIANSDYVSLYLSKTFSSYLIFDSGLAIIYQFFIVLALIFVIYFFLFQTRKGLHLRACGESIRVSTTYGISVIKNRYLALILGSILIAFAGSLFAETKASFDGRVNGYGYLGLAILILGRRNIFLITFFTAFFVILQTYILSFDNSLQELLNIANYLLPLLVLLILGIFKRKEIGKNAIPKNLGK